MGRREGASVTSPRTNGRFASDPDACTAGHRAGGRARARGAVEEREREPLAQAFITIPLPKGLCSEISEHRQFSQSSSQTVWQYFAIWQNSNNSSMENIRTHSNFCKYRNFTRKYRRITTHFFRATVKFNKLLSLCYFQNCTNENVPGDL